jgi:D-tyrosyl-tRNA(Tyr) deacylase
VCWRFTYWGISEVRVVVQRSKEAKVVIDGETVGAIDFGLVLLVGITHEDTIDDVKWMADKVAGLRIFEDESGKMNLAVTDIGGQLLSVSQFTLYGDCRKGRRPNFMAAARPEQAEPLYDAFNAALRERGLKVETGRFGAMMNVELVNSGPVTLILESGA